MNTRQALDWTALGSVFGILLILILLIGVALQRIISPEGFVVGAGTFLLSMATFYLAFTERAESISNRIQIRELAEKDRRRLRLKEQLEGLYSPLMSHIVILDNISEHRGDPVLSLMQKLRGKFEFLAEDDLKDVLREYYDTDLDSISKDKWEDLTNAMIDTIGNGCTDISLEYDDLTRKVS